MEPHPDDLEPVLQDQSLTSLPPQPSIATTYPAYVVEDYDDESDDDPRESSSSSSSLSSSWRMRWHEEQEHATTALVLTESEQYDILWFLTRRVSNVLVLLKGVLPLKYDNLSYFKDLAQKIHEEVHASPMKTTVQTVFEILTSLGRTCIYIHIRSMLTRRRCVCVCVCTRFRFTMENMCRSDGATQLRFSWASKYTFA
jgi:hypothetical protein